MAWGLARKWAQAKPLGNPPKPPQPKPAPRTIPQGKMAPVWLPPPLDRPQVLATVDGKGTLANPRAPSTTMPRQRLDGPAAPAVSNPSRPPDRGARVPVLGIRQHLPNGEVGVVPRMPKPLMAGLERSLIVRGNVSVGQTVATAAKKAVNAQRLHQKMRVRIVPGDSGLMHAKRGPLRLDPRTGRELYRDGIGQRTKPKTLRGNFVQHMTAPADMSDLAAQARMARAFQGAPGAGVPRMRPDPARQVSDTTALTAPTLGVALGRQGDQETAAVRPAPDPELTTGVGAASDVWGNVAFLAAAVFIGWLVLKGRR